MRRTVLGMFALLVVAIIASQTSCATGPPVSSKSDASREARAVAAGDDTRRHAESRNDTATGDYIVMQIDMRDPASAKDPFAKELPLIAAKNAPPTVDEVLGWFAPLKAVADNESTPTPFYPTGSRWLLVDASGVKRGKVSIDRFGTIYYLRIGKSDDPAPARFRIRLGNTLVKEFISSHGGLPTGKLTIASEGFRESAPGEGRAVWYQRGFGHQFRGVPIYDDTLEAGVSKLYGTHYVRRWHEFKAHGKDKPLLDADTLAERVIGEYRALWRSAPQQYADVLSGKLLVTVSLEQLVYFDPRPRDPKRFGETRAMYHPGWLIKVYSSEAQTDGFSNGPELHVFEEHVPIGVPLLIVDAHTGEIFERKPPGENLFR